MNFNLCMCIYILGIESSCDDTSAAILKDNIILSNIIANQKVHENFGGVVPELASRAHQQNIIPVIHQALQTAKISKNNLHAIAYTRGPGLLGSLLVGSSLAKAMAFGLNIPLIDVDHMQAHILAHFIKYDDTSHVPEFPFLCLTVSGGHTLITLVRDFFDMEVIGQTIDDAAGEAFDKAAKIMGIPYPGGPLVDKFAQQGNPDTFKFALPKIKKLDFSFSGLKTSFLYFIRDQLKKNIDFIEQNKYDLCASIQQSIIQLLMDKVKLAVTQTGIRHIAVAGGVSANSFLRKELQRTGDKMNWKVYIPKFEFCTDNAAMIAVTGYYKFINQSFAPQDIVPYARSLKI